MSLTHAVSDLFQDLEMRLQTQVITTLPKAAGDKFQHFREPAAVVLLW